LSDACRLIQLIVNSGINFDNLLINLLESSSRGLEFFMQSDSLKFPPDYRLAFRELGLAIGIHGIEIMQEIAGRKSSMLSYPQRTGDLLTSLLSHTSLAETLENFWLNPEHQEATTWREHLNINSVMLATSLIPEGFLLI